MLLDLSFMQTGNGNSQSQELTDTALLPSTSTNCTGSKDILDASTISRISLNNSPVTVDDTSSIISTKPSESEADDNIRDNVLALRQMEQMVTISDSAALSPLLSTMSGKSDYPKPKSIILSHSTPSKPKHKDVTQSTKNKKNTRTEKKLHLQWNLLW